MNHKDSLFRESLYLSYGGRSRLQLYSRAKGSLELIQRLKLEYKLQGHNGCVNTICWNDTGTLILSGSDDQHLHLTDPFSKKVEVSIQSGHRANIFSAKFLPSSRDKKIISCSGDGVIYYSNLEREDLYGYYAFDCHFGTTYEVMTVPNDPHTFLSCGEDGTVRWFDLRLKEKCTREDCKEDILINCRRAVTALAINPMLPYQLGVACADSTVRVFDRRMLGTRATGNYVGKGILGMISCFTAPGLESRAHRITSLQYSSDGQEVLVSYSSDYIYLFNMQEDNANKHKVMSKNPDQECSKEGAIGRVEGGSPRQPPIKRLRLRGDWSDTGPNARPERERGSEGGERGSVTIMQRMSDMLTRWLEGATRNMDDQEPGEQAGASATGGQEEQSSEQQGCEQAQGEANGPSNRDTTSGLEKTCDGGSEPLPCTSGHENDQDYVKAEDGDVNNISGKEEIKSTEDRIEEGALLKEEKSEDVTRGDTNSSVTVSPVKYDGKECNKDMKQNGPLATCDDSDVDDNRTSQTGQIHVQKSVSIKDRSCSSNISQCDKPESFLTKPAEPSLVENLKFQKGKQVSTSSSQSNESVSKLEGSSSQTGEVETNDNPVSQSEPLYRTCDTRSGVEEAQLEPVISLSLHYHTQGTSSSTIRVDFTSSEDELPRSRLQASIQPARHSPQTPSRQASVRTERRSVAEESPNTTVGYQQESQCKKEEYCVYDKDTADKSNTDSLQDSMPEISQEASMSTSMPVSSDVTHTLQSVTEMPSSKYEMVSQEQQHASETEKNTPSSSFTEVMEECKDSTSDTDISLQKSVASTSQEACEKCAKVREEGDLSQDANKSNRKPSSTETDEEPSKGSATIVVPEIHEEGLVEDCVEHASAASEVNEYSREGPQRRRGHMTRASTSNGPGTSGRMRRYGHSGPSTGDFQLHSTSDDEDDDSDVELMRASHRSQRLRENAERNIAARRLQALYRKRKEEREKEEQDMLNIPHPEVKKIYKGHRNARTMIKEANFWGDKYVMSGSDCGHVFVWDRHSSDLVMLLEADRHVVNCLQPHPYDPVLATSGIDYDIKIWMPTAVEPSFEEDKAYEVVRRNEIMLEETRDTITVPASFMLRMLASLNNIRTGRRTSGRGEEDSSSSSDE